MKKYLFADLETTGTDPSSDAILEVAWFITNDHYEVISDPRAYTVNIEEGHTAASIAAMDAFVRVMHTESGLLDEVDSGATLDYVFSMLVDDLEEHVGVDDTVHIAGFSIHFDVDFLKANDFGSLFRNPSRRPYIHHRHLDLSSVKMAMEDADLTTMIGYDENPKPHRALYDCYEALAYARRVRGFLNLAVPFPPVGSDTAVAIISDDVVLAELDDDVVTIDLTKYEGNL